jgi:hypothetical protein
MTAKHLQHRGAASAAAAQVVKTDILPRLDRLPWSRFHSLVAVAARHHLDSRRPRGDHRRADNRQRFRRHVVPRGVDPLGKQPKGIDSVEIGGQVSPRSLARRDRRQRRP